MSHDNVGLRLDHLYMLAKKPEWMADWYAETFGFKVQEGIVICGAVVLVFQNGEPDHHHDRPRFGFRCSSREKFKQLAHKLDATVNADQVFARFVAKDPEGYKFEVYWEAQP